MAHIKILVFFGVFSVAALAAPDRNTSDLTINEFFKTKDGQKYISIVQYKFAQEEIEATGYFKLADTGDLQESNNASFDKQDSTSEVAYGNCNFLLPAQLDSKITDKKIAELMSPFLKKEEVNIYQLNVVSYFKNPDACVALVQFDDPHSVLVKYNEKLKTVDMIRVDGAWQFDSDDVTAESKIVFSSNEVTWISYRIVSDFDNIDLIEINWDQRKAKKSSEIFDGAKVEFFKVIDDLMIIGLSGHEIKIYKSGKQLKSYTSTYDSKNKKILLTSN